MSERQLTSRDIYKTLWKCRDFELSTLWQRSAMLGVFMVVTYTGYGALLLNAFEHGCATKWVLFNLLAIGLCCFGMIFSALWIMMLKGSKRWSERHEAALNGFESVRSDDVFENDQVRSDVAFGISYSPATLKALKEFCVNESLMSADGGRFSVSRTAIAIGQVSLVGWVCLSFVHATALFVGIRITRYLMKVYGPFFGFALLAFCLVGVCIVLKDHVGSSSS